MRDIPHLAVLPGLWKLRRFTGRIPPFLSRPAVDRRLTQTYGRGEHLQTAKRVSTSPDWPNFS